MIAECLKIIGCKMKFRSCQRLLFLIILANVTVLFVYMILWTDRHSFKNRRQFLHANFAYKDAGHKIKFKTIYLATPFHNNSNWFQRKLGFSPAANCKISDCYFTSFAGSLKNSDAVLFHGPSLQSKYIPKVHPTNQSWIFYSPDPPTSMANKFGGGDLNLERFHGLFNWAATYKQDSDIVLSFGGYKAKRVIKRNLIPINYALGRSGLVAWKKNNCKTNYLDYYVKELKKHMSVDIFGKCGNFNCSDKSDCNEIIRKDYRFFLAFENVNCHDFITKRFWWALNNSVIPIVMGAKYEEYLRIAPPNSFIHTSQFDSPKHLSQFILKLAEDDLKYNTYFEWKKKYDIISLPGIESSIFCQVCAKLHSNLTKFKILKDFTSWWSLEENCWT